MINEILFVHHSHTDIGYTHPQPLVWDLHNRYLDEAIEHCERTAGYPEGSRMKWTCEVTSVALNWLKTASPSQIKRMRKLVANGQMSFGAMLYHWTALHQEDMLRESLQAIRVVRDALGADIRFAMQTDVNGTPWSVPDMLLDAGVDPNTRAVARVAVGDRIDVEDAPPGETLLETVRDGRPDLVILDWNAPGQPAREVVAALRADAVTRDAKVLLLVEQVMAWNARLGLISLLASPLGLLLFAVAPAAAVVMLAAGALVLIGLRWRKRSAV